VRFEKRNWFSFDVFVILVPVRGFKSLPTVSQSRKSPAIREFLPLANRVRVSGLVVSGLVFSGL
jgi:hypothetical protein